MSKKFIIAAFAAICTFQSAHSADAPSPRILTPKEIPDWVAGLKCRDILTEDNEINWATMQPFSLWLHGYLTGFASSLPLDGLPAKTFHLFEWFPLVDFNAGVLTVCNKHKDWDAVEAALDVAALAINSVSKKAIRLRGPNGKWE
jgi:hypothetical protein